MTDTPDAPDAFDLAILQGRGAAVRRIEAGEPVFFEHRSGAEMFAVVSGRIDVVTYGKVLEQVGPGGIVGEMALIDDEPRSAAAVAAEDSEVAVIPRPLFLMLVGQEPQFALFVMRVLARRLRNRPGAKAADGSS